MPDFPINFIAVLVAALIPLVVGFLWYNPNVFGRAWMKASGMTEEKAKGANMPVIMIVSLIMNVLVAFVLATMVVHQSQVFSLVATNVDPEEAKVFLTETMSKYGQLHRGFGHGVLHGVIAGLFFGLPMITTHALYERKGFKYIAINAGYWIVNLALMGGLICAWQ